MAGIYLYAMAYLAAPVMGWHLDSATIAEAFGSLNEYAKFGLKFLVALPFSFHSWNGIRHLMWDTASELSLKGGMCYLHDVRRSSTDACSLPYGICGPWTYGGQHYRIGFDLNINLLCCQVYSVSDSDHESRTLLLHLLLSCLGYS